MAPVERPALSLCSSKISSLKFMFPQLFKNYVSDIEVHGKKVELVYGIKRDSKIRTGYALCPVPTTDFLSICLSVASPDGLKNITDS